MGVVDRASEAIIDLVAGKRGGDCTYGDVGSVEWRSDGVCGRVRTGAFECDDGAELADRGLRGGCTGEVEGG